jgi:hypothetical protein
LIRQIYGGDHLEILIHSKNTKMAKLESINGLDDHLDILSTGNHKMVIPAKFVLNDPVVYKKKTEM